MNGKKIKLEDVQKVYFSKILGKDYQIGCDPAYGNDYNAFYWLDLSSNYEVSCGSVRPPRKKVESKEVEWEIPALDFPTVEAEQKLLEGNK